VPHEWQNLTADAAGGGVVTTTGGLAAVTPAAFCLSVKATNASAPSKATERIAITIPLPPSQRFSAIGAGPVTPTSFLPIASGVTVPGSIRADDAGGSLAGAAGGVGGGVDNFGVGRRVAPGVGPEAVELFVADTAPAGVRLSPPFAVV
jgi:hypothetical protein